MPECKSKSGCEGTSEAIPKNWITKLQTTFAECEKKISSLQNKIKLNVSNQNS